VSLATPATYTVPDLPNAFIFGHILIDLRYPLLIAPIGPSACLRFPAKHCYSAIRAEHAFFSPQREVIATSRTEVIKECNQFLMEMGAFGAHFQNMKFLVGAHHIRLGSSTLASLAEPAANEAKPSAPESQSSSPSASEAGTNLS